MFFTVTMLIGTSCSREEVNTDNLNIITMILPHLTVWSSLFPLRSKKGSSRSGSGWGHYSGTARSENIKSKILNLQFAINCFSSSYLEVV